jgi:hypothetical protein
MSDQADQTTTQTSGTGSILSNPGDSIDAQPASWRELLPEEIRNAPVIQQVNAESMADAFKNISSQLVGVQPMIGADKAILPKDWTNSEQTSEFYNKIGRPENFDAYKTPEFEDAPQGFSIDDEIAKGDKEVLWNAGLREDQAQAVLNHFYGRSKDAFQEINNQEALSNQEAQLKLKEMYGAETDFKIALAAKAFNQFADEGLQQKLDNMGVSNDPQFVSLMATIGEQMLEHNTFKTTATSGFSSPAEVAKVQISERLNDPSWMEALQDPSHPRHEAVVKERISLYKQANPSNSQ